jgi:hypothetical protein
MKVAELLVSRGLLTPQKVVALSARTAGRAPGPSGSVMLDLAVELNVVPRPAAIALLGQARALVSSGPPSAPPSLAPPPPAQPAGDDEATMVGMSYTPGPAPGPSSSPGQTFAPGMSAAAPMAAPGADATLAPAPGARRPLQRPPSTAAPAVTLAGPVPTAPTPAPKGGDGTWMTWGASPAGGATAAELSALFGAPAAPAPNDDATRATGPGDTLMSTSALAPASGAGRYEVVSSSVVGQRRLLDRRLQRTLDLVTGASAKDLAVTRHARILAQLEHPAIPRLHDLLVWDGRTSFTTDVVEGETFEEVRGLNQAAALRVFLDVAAAVAHAHKRGLAHGSLGPWAVTVGEFGRTWVTGWEVARALPDAPESAVRAAMDEEAAAPPPEGRRRAPELARAPHVAPTERSDVFGLGLVLERALTFGASSGLRAVVDKALAKEPRARYEDAASLAEDVRRALDGRAVGALRETPLHTLRRLAGHHPVAAGIVAGAALVVAAGSTLALQRTRREYARVVAEEQRASEARVRAEADEKAAGEALAAARAREALGDLRLDLERTLGSGAAGPRLERAQALLERLQRDAKAVGDVDTTLAAARVTQARADDDLRGAAPDPARALKGYARLDALLAPRVERAAVGQGGADAFGELRLARGQLADARLGRFLAARRLPGPAGRQAEEAALEAMAAFDGTKELARLERAVRALEVEAEAGAVLRPLPRALSKDEERIKPVLADVEAFVAARYDLAYAHELLGRLAVALSGPGLHRWQKVQRFDGEHQVEYGALFSRAFAEFFRAHYLDPTEPMPRVGYLQEWNAKFALHFPWRWIGGWALGNAIRTAKGTPRPAALLAVAGKLTAFGRAPSLAALVEPYLRRTDLSDDERGALELHRARALLASGVAIAPDEVAALRPPPELAADHRLLHGWALLASGATQQGLETVFSSLQTGVPLSGLSDFQDALCDPRIDPRALGPLLDPAIPPPGTNDASPIAHCLLLARVMARGRLGLPDATGDVPRLRQFDERVKGGTRASAQLELAVAMAGSQLDPVHPGSHLQALWICALVNLYVGSTESVVEEARDLIVARLRRLGAADAARQFQELDPVGELNVRRAWVPEEAYPWRAAGRAR